MAKLTIHGREMEVCVTMPRIFVKDASDLEFLAVKYDQLYERSTTAEAVEYKTDARLLIDLSGAFVLDIVPPPSPQGSTIVAENIVFRGLWRAEANLPEIVLVADRGVER